MNRREFIVASSAVTGIAVTDTAVRASTAQMPDFRFHSNLWMNLHHTLYYQAQVLETAYAAGAAHLVPMDRQVLADCQKLCFEDEHAWPAALRLYHENYTSQDFVFSDAMQRIDQALITAPGDSPPSHSGLPAPLLQAFDLAAPAYRRVQWPRDDSANRSFVAQLQTHLHRFGPELAQRLSRIYRTNWLSMPIEVSVMPYAQAEGSYSNNADAFVYIAMSTSDAVEQGLGGLDVLFHETSHSITDPRHGSIGSAIQAAARGVNRPVPDQFWHAVIMYTPGRLTEELFERAGLGSYTMFAKRDGLFTRVWPRYYDALSAHWQPYMDGHGTLEDALAKCVREIVQV